MTDSRPLLPWPTGTQSVIARTTLSCGHYGLIGCWDYHVIGRKQHCEVCDCDRTVVVCDET